MSLALVIGLGAMARPADAEPVCTACGGPTVQMQTLSSLTQPHVQQVRQYGLFPSITPDRLKLRGWIASGSFVPGWVGEIDGAAVCFGDNGTANGFSGPNSYVLAPGPFNGTAGWFTAATVHKYVDVGTTKVKLS